MGIFRRRHRHNQSASWEGAALEGGGDGADAADGRSKLRAAWYADPRGHAKWRYWDGTTWTENTKDVSAEEVEAALDRLDRGEATPLEVAALLWQTDLIVPRTETCDEAGAATLTFSTFSDADGRQ